MKRGKQVILIISAVLLLTLFMIGCNQPQQQPTTPPTTTTPPATTPTPTAAATYVGTETCKQCHSGHYDEFSGTKHTQTFKPLSDYKFDKDYGQITIYDGSSDSEKSAKIDLSKAYGIQMDDYVVASVPGFTDKFSRVAKIEKSGDVYKMVPATHAPEDINKDGTPDFVAENYSCGPCHSPGLEAGSKEYGFGCEACHGPGSVHASAPVEKKKETMPLPGYNKCEDCHHDAPSKNKDGKVVTTNHYGVRDYSASKHATTGQVNGCLTCHDPHKANANGQLIRKDKPADICVACHAGKNYDPDKIMWKNPTDPYGHITHDHSFTAMKYEDLGDDPNTKDVEITKQPMLDLVKKIWPDVVK